MGVCSETTLERVEQLIGEGRYNEAAELCQTLLCRDPNNIEALFLAGNLAFRGKAWRTAITRFREACRLDPANPVLLNNLGLALMEAAQSREPVAGASLEEAALVFEKALALQSEYVTAWKNLGIVRREQGDTDKALFCFKRGSPWLRTTLPFG